MIAARSCAFIVVSPQCGKGAAQFKRRPGQLGRYGCVEMRYSRLFEEGFSVAVKLPRGLDNLINIVDIDGHLTTPSWRPALLRLGTALLPGLPQEGSTPSCRAST